MTAFPPLLGPPTPMHHTTMAALDIIRFGDRAGDDVQAHLRRVMYELAEDGFAITGLPWADCHREDRGDGALIVAPAGTTPERWLDPLVHHLLAGIRRYNRFAADAVRLRLRLAIHSGLVRYDPHGVVGHCVVHLFRMLNATAFRKLLTATDAELGAIVSDDAFDHVMRQGGLIDPDAYRPIRIHCKETRAQAWAWLPPQLEHARRHAALVTEVGE
jgi:hypothetical protein